MTKKINFLTDEQIDRLKKLIIEQKNSGGSLLSISGMYPEFKYKTVLYWAKIIATEDIKIKKPVKAKKMKKLLNYAKENNLSLADLQRENPKISMGSFQHWNRVFKILPIKKGCLYSENKILEILGYAKDFGVAVAAEKYNIDVAQIYGWNVDSEIFETVRKTKEYTEEYVIKLLNEALEYNKSNNSRSGIRVVSKKYDIAHTNLYTWNKKHKIIISNHKAKQTLLSDVEIDYIVKTSHGVDTVKELAILVGRGQITVKRVLEMRGIKCDRNGISYPENTR